MTETARKLQEAEAAEQRGSARADAEKRACLERVARELSAKLDAFAKKVALDEPEVTESLGAEKIKRVCVPILQTRQLYSVLNCRPLPIRSNDL